MSDNFPHNMVVVVLVSVNAMKIQLMRLSPPRSAAMVGYAVATIVLSIDAVICASSRPVSSTNMRLRVNPPLLSVLTAIRRAPRPASTSTASSSAATVVPSPVAGVMSLRKRVLGNAPRKDERDDARGYAGEEHDVQATREALDDADANRVGHLEDLTGAVAERSTVDQRAVGHELRQPVVESTDENRVL